MSNTLVNEAVTTSHDQPVKRLQIVALAAVALPAFGGLVLCASGLFIVRMTARL
jgi:hypothetical protein